MSRRAAWLSFVLLAAACGRGRGTPAEMLDAIRSAGATADARTVYDLHSGDARAIARQRVREWRARLERKDPPDEVLRDAGLTPDEVAAGSIDDAAAKMMTRFSPIVAEAPWFAGATLVEVQTESETTAGLRLRGADGRESTLWLVRENDLWAIDGPRSWENR